MMLHDSTGSRLWKNKLVEEKEKLAKLWCPNLEKAASVLATWGGKIKKTVTLISGIRDARSLVEGKLSEDTIVDNVKAFTDKVLALYPGVQVILSSVLPNLDRKLNNCVEVVHNALQMVAESSATRITRCDTYQVFAQLDLYEVMDDQEGTHVKPRFLGILAKSERDAIHNRHDNIKWSNYRTANSKASAGRNTCNTRQDPQQTHRQVRRNAPSAPAATVKQASLTPQVEYSSPRDPTFSQQSTSISTPYAQAQMSQALVPMTTPPPGYQQGQYIVPVNHINYNTAQTCQINDQTHRQGPWWPIPNNNWPVYEQCVTPYQMYAY
jgi:hypothetical protein